MKNLFFIFSLLLFSLPSLAGVTSDTLWTHARHEMQRGNYEEAYRAYQQLSSLQDTTYKQIYFKDIEDLHDRYQFNDLKLENEQRESRQKRDLIKFLFFFIGVSAITATLLYFSNKRLNRIRKKLNEERKMAEASIRGKSLFLSTMSHEIRTPLNALAGFSEVLSMDGIDDETVKISNDAIQMNSELLLKLIRDVADMSMVDMEHMKFHLDSCNAVSLCVGVAETMEKIKHTSALIQFKSELKELMLQTDSSRIQQVLINLIVNASKFTKTGSITIGLEVRDDEAYFSVTDTGCGIAPEQQQKIFNKFEKLNEAVQGTGLGLAICKAIIQGLGGKIWVDPSYTGGSRFIFTQPLGERSKS